MKRIPLLACVLYCIALHAQPAFWSSPHAYLGQTPPGDTPMQFAAGMLVVKDSFDMDRVGFSEDGKEFYYETNNTWYSTVPVVLRSFAYKGGQWVGPTVVLRGFWSPSFSADLLGACRRWDCDFYFIFGYYEDRSSANEACQGRD